MDAVHKRGESDSLSEMLSFVMSKIMVGENGPVGCTKMQLILFIIKTRMREFYILRLNAECFS